MNLPKTELTNNKIAYDLMIITGGKYDDKQEQKMLDYISNLIHQAEIKARIDELIKLKKAHSITIFDEYLENHIQALEKEIE